MHLFASVSRLRRAGLIGAAMISSGLFACGPDFPNCYLSNSFEDLSKLPALSFENELMQLVKIKLRPPLEGKAEEAAERAEVRQALRERGVSASQADAEAREYCREKPPAALPAEFQLYARGAQVWHAQRREDAVAAWQELLALPAEARRRRSVWAAFMIGRAWCDTAPARAREACRLARRLAAEGFADSQHLADASLGWEARAFLNEQDYVAALRLYAQQLGAGDNSAVGSLQITLLRVFRGGAGDNGDGAEAAAATPAADEHVLAALAADAPLRGIVTAWFAARGGRSLRWGPEADQQFRRWIAVLPAAKNLAPEEADRWCWAAYQNGMWNEARRFAALAPQGAPASEWVRAMLLLRAGSVDDAAEHLSRAAAGFATDAAFAASSPLIPADEDGCRPLMQPLGDEPAGQLAGVRGVLALHRSQYVEALRLFLAADHWSDAAYVAERVLTPDELVEFTNAFTAEKSHDGAGGDGESIKNLRHLTARRLVRAGQFDRASEFFPEELREKYRDYLADVRLGFDAKAASRKRAEALWSAARLIHEVGMEIQGTELEPDFGITEGGFEWPQLDRTRNLGGERRYWWRAEAERAARESDFAPLQPSVDEMERLQTTPPPARRFHYRYRAAELAWLSAALLPNDDGETAVVLHTAGKWIAYRDPGYADLFYKTLVLRCPNTELGRRAAERRWFVRDHDDRATKEGGGI